MELVLNGKPVRVEAHGSLAELLVDLQLAGKRVAVERNGHIVPRSAHASTPVGDGDRIEIVCAVGGG